MAAALLVALASGAASPARAAGPSVVVMADRGVERDVRRRVGKVVATRRALKPLRRLPAPQVEAPEQVADAERVQAIALSLERARRRESEAAWEACAREAAGALGDAIEVLVHTSRLSLLRDLHVQIGVCMTLGEHPANARPHFLAAILLDETPPQPGRYREEAEEALAEAREEVLARSRGPVRIHTDPAGAEVRIDGRKAAGRTPLTVDVRLGDHFVTVRRFRFEPHTERRVLQPGSRITIVLDEARRATLREQLAEVAGRRRKVSAKELRLARAAWSGAAQLLWLSRQRPWGGAEARPAPTAPAGDGPLLPLAEQEDPSATPVRLKLIETVTGRVLRRRTMADPTDEESLRNSVCDTLGETCEPPEAGIPWYVWPIAGAALAGAAVAAGFIIDAARPTVFCPSTGCE